jgi:branched-chain amino acid aminotransferase
MKKNRCFLNGKILDERDAKISVNDIGLHRNYGVFEVLRTYNGAPFLLKEHLNRLFKSAKEIGLVIPYSKKEISENISKILQKNKEVESLIKILVTGGNQKTA